MHLSVFRLRSALLAAVLLLAPAYPGFSAVRAAAVFSDLTGHWAAADVQFLVDRSVVQGFPDGTFRPDQPTSRGEFMALLARQAQIAWKSDGPALPFTVVPPEHWAMPALRGLVAAGVVRAGEDDPFDLTAPVTRREMARWLVRAEGWDAASQPVDSWLTDVPGDADAAAISAAISHDIFNGYPDRTFRPASGATRAEVAAAVARLLDGRRRPAFWRQRFSIAVGDATVELRVVGVNLLRNGLKPRVVLGADHIGGTESLAGMAGRTGAVAAINGTYLQAYRDDIPKEPYGTIITGGQVVHVGGDRAAIGFFPDGRVRVDVIGPSIRGSGATGDWHSNWYADGLNHHGPSGYGNDWSVVYTPAHGGDTGNPLGTTVTVRQGIVTGISDGATAIPPDGFLVNFGGAEKSQLHAFAPGRPATFHIDLGKGWDGVQELLQAGPRLLAGGNPALNLSAEGFTEDKITTLAWARSAVATTADGRLLLVTSPSATVYNLAQALAQVGAQDALCMDSGASSGLWYRGDLVTEPGRALSDALVFMQQ